MPAAAPGPKLSLLGSLIYRPGGADPLDFFTNLARTYGDVSSYRMAGEQVFLVNEPRLIRDVLVTHNRNFTKSRGLERSKRLLGQGLLTSEGAMHLRQRRLMQPAFHRERIAGYGDLMVGYADRMRRGWTNGAVLDISREMNRLTLSIVGKTLFDVDVEQQAASVGEALTAVMESFWMMMLPFAEVLERLPVPRLRRARMARARLDAIIYGMIADRRASGRDHGDLLSMLLAAQDDEEKLEGDGNSELGARPTPGGQPPNSQIPGPGQRVGGGLMAGEEDRHRLVAHLFVGHPAGRWVLGAGSWVLGVGRLATGARPSP